MARNGMRSNFINANQQPPGGLRHGFDQQHTGQQRVAREVSLEDGVVLGNLGLDP